jgi:xylulokinase
MVGTGAYRSVPEACGAIIRETETIEPNPSLTSRYADIFRQYQRLYPALAGEFQRLMILTEAG